MEGKSCRKETAEMIKDGKLKMLLLKIRGSLLLHFILRRNRFSGRIKSLDPLEMLLVRRYQFSHIIYADISLVSWSV